MHKRLYKFSRKSADAWCFVTELLLIAAFIYLLSKGAQIYTALIATAGIAHAIYRMIKGPIVAPVILEITNEELIWRMHYYVPTKTLQTSIICCLNHRVHEDGQEHAARDACAGLRSRAKS